MKKTAKTLLVAEVLQPGLAVGEYVTEGSELNSRVPKCPECGGPCGYQAPKGPTGCLGCGKAFAWSDLKEWAR